MAVRDFPSTEHIRREALLARYGRVHPRILELVAPAGYGKSTFARQVTEGLPTAVCDCSGVTDLKELARHLLRSFAELWPDKTSFLIQCEVQSAHGLSVAADLALQAWRQECAPHAFIIENAEMLSHIDGARGFFSKMLATSPIPRTLILCSRQRLPVRFGRFASGSELLSLGSLDLAFTAQECARVFSAHTLPTETLDRLFDFSRGWPMLVALFEGFARDGTLEPLLRRLETVPLERVQRHVIDEAYSRLPPLIKEALIVIALVPETTTTDLGTVMGDEASRYVCDYVHSSPFVTLHGGKFALHPLIEAMLRERFSSRRAGLLANLARRHEDERTVVRAAELHLANGDQESAARNLDAIPWLEQPAPSLRIARIIGSLDRSVLMKFPQLWGISVAYSRFSIDPMTAVGEAREILAKLGESSPPSERMHVIRPLAGYLSRLGMHDEAYRMICELEHALEVPRTPQSVNEAAVLYIRMMIAGRLGRLNESLELAERARLLLLRHDGTAAIYLTEQASEVMRPLGRREQERAMLDAAIQRSLDGHYAVNAALALAEASFGAFLAGEDVLFEGYVRALNEQVEADAVRGLWYYAAVARGERNLPPLGSELPKWIACAHIVAAAAAEDPQDALTHATAAREAAIRYSSPFVQVIATLVYGEVCRGPRSVHAAAAFELAQSLESPSLHESLQAYIAGDEDIGMLAPLIRRFRRPLPKRARSCHLLVLSGEVIVDSDRIALSDRKMEVLTVLAVSRHGMSRESILERVWPALPGAAALNAFNLCIHQLRRILGEEAILLVRDRYRLGDNVRVDIRQIEEFLPAVDMRADLSVSQLAVLERFHAQIQQPFPERYESWVWFGETERRIEELRCDVVAKLADAALRRCDFPKALALARDILEHDPCDEPAREIAIRAYVASGDQAAAFREYRRYRNVLMEELGAAPALVLETLLLPLDPAKQLESIVR